MTRVIFTPVKNSERSAIARFGDNWQIACWSGLDRPERVKGVKCVHVHPVGFPWEGRWVPPSQVVAR